MANAPNTPNYSRHFVWQVPGGTKKSNFCTDGRVIFVLAKLNVCCKVISLPPPTLLKKWVRRQGRRWCSDEGEWEGQELTSECVLTTPIRSLAHKHCSFKYAQDRHVHRRPWNGKSSCSAVSRKNPLCLTICLVFVCAHTRSYVLMTYENVSGSFETPSCFRNVHTRHELPCVRKVLGSP